MTRAERLDQTVDGSPTVIFPHCPMIPGVFIMRRTSRSQSFLGIAMLILAGTAFPCRAEDLPVINDVEFQPLSAQVRRVVESLDMLGQPLPAADKAKIERAIGSIDLAAAVRTIQQTLDKYCLIGVQINPESRVKAIQGPAPARLVQNGWRSFLVKVYNEAGVTA